MARYTNPLPCLPVRAEGKSQAELVTQVLYGESYNVLEKGKEWTKIRNNFDGYEGYISTNQIGIERQEESEGLVTDLVERRNGIWLPMGANVPKGRGNLSLENAIQQAQKFIGVPYLWGGKTLMGIDCSGFVQVVFKTCGVPLKRDASQQALQGEAVDFDLRKATDLAFFQNNQGRVTHVGLVLDERTIIHAAGKVRIDVLDEKGIFKEQTNEYTHQFHSIRRFS